MEIVMQDLQFEYFVPNWTFHSGLIKNVYFQTFSHNVLMVEN